MTRKKDVTTLFIIFIVIVLFGSSFLGSSINITNLGEGAKTFTNSLTVGDQKITSTRPDYSCDQENDWNAPNPEPECWQTTVKFRDAEVDITHDKAKAFHNCFPSIYYSVVAHFESDYNLVDQYSNNFVATLNRDCLFPITTGNDYYIGKDSSAFFSMAIHNEFANFAVDQAGYRLIKTTDLVTTQTIDYFPREIKEGENEFIIPLDTSIYGETEYRVLPYFKLGDDIYFDDQEVVYTYKVVDDVPEPPINPGNVDIEEPQEPPEEEPEDQDNSTKIYAILVIVGFILLLILI